MADSLQLLIKSGFDATGITAATNSINAMEGQISRVSRGFSKFTSLMMAGGAGYAVFNFAKAAVQAFQKQEDAISKVEAAMKSQGTYSRTLSRQYQSIASEIQKLTTVGDEEALSLMQMAVSMGVNSDQVGEATKQAIGLSKAYGVDLNSAMKMVALAGQGEYTMMNRYIPQLRSLTTNTEKAAMVTKLLGDGFKLAQAEAGTSAGKMKQLSNSVGDLREIIGEQLMPVVGFWADRMGEVVGWLNKLRDASKRESTAGMSGYEKRLNALDEQIRRKRELIALQKDYTERESWLSPEAYQKEVKMYASLVRSRKDLMASKPAPGPTPPPSAPLKTPAQLKAEKAAKDAADKAAADDKKRALSYIQSATMTQDEITRIETDALVTRLQKRGEHDLAIGVMDAKRTADAKAQEELRAQNFAATMSNISALATSKNKELAAVGKAASIAQAGMDTYAAANVALKSSPPPFSYILAAATIAVGLANVARISSYATGGAINKTGPALLHSGEFVLSANVVKAIKDGKPTSGLGAGAAPAGGGNSLTINQSIVAGSGADVKAVFKAAADGARKGVTEFVDFARVSYKVGVRRAGETSL